MVNEHPKKDLALTNEKLSKPLKNWPQKRKRKWDPN